MNIRQVMATPNPYSRPCTPLRGVKGIVLHYTESPSASAYNIARYFNNLKDTQDRYASAHYAVDNNEAILIIPLNEMAYHVGASSYKQDALNRLSSYPNNCSIGIEMCTNANDEIEPQTVQNTLELTVQLCKQFGLNETNLFRHFDITGKNCPAPWVANPAAWNKFRQDVARLLHPAPIPAPIPVPVPIPQPLQPPSPVLQWEIDAVKKALSIGLIKDNHDPHEKTQLVEALAILLNAMKIPYVNVSPDWRVNTLQTALNNGIIHDQHKPDEPLSDVVLLTILLNALHIPIPQVSPDWRVNVMTAAHNAGLIKDNHNPNEIANMAFTLTVIMNALHL